MLLLPAGTFLLLWLAARDRGRRLGFEDLTCRGALLIAYVAFEILLLAMTEVTSLGDHFTAGTVGSAWAVATVVLLAVSRASLLRFVRQLASPEWRRSVRKRAGDLGAEHWLWVAVLVAMGAVLVAVGGLYQPNNGDSMIYHLARVEHWVQDRTVAPFATHYTAQVELSPLSEYNLANLHLLSGTDRFDAYVELLAAVVCVAGVSEMARLLGGSRRTQLVAAVVCATIPTGVLLATSTENDYVAAATTLCLLVFAASFRLEGPWLARSIAVGAAAGLSYMTKGTTPALMWPAAAALVALAAFRERASVRLDNFGRLVLTRAGAMAGAGLAVALPFVYQNFELFGRVVGPTEKTTVIPTYDPAAMAADIVRGTALNFDVGDGVSGISTYLSRLSLDVLGPVYHLFGVGMDDPRFSFSTAPFDPFLVRDYSVFSRQEVFGGSPWHVLLLVIAFVVTAVGVVMGRRWLRTSLVLAVGLVVGYLAFNALAKWSPFNVRYNLPSLVAWSAVIAVALAMTRRWVARVVMIGLLVACLPQLLNNATRPLVPPQGQGSSILAGYFPSLEGLGSYSAGLSRMNARSYQVITEALAHSTCHQAAIGNWILVEYPIWRGLALEGWKGVIRDTDVHNQTKKLEHGYRACAVLSQQAPHYFSPTNGTVTFQEPIFVQFESAKLVLAVDVVDGASIAAQPGFRSEVPTLRVQPGGGWSMRAYGPLPLLRDGGSVYVYDRPGSAGRPAARTVQVALVEPAGARQLPPEVSSDGAPPVAMGTVGDRLVASVPVHSGDNQLRFSLQGGPRANLLLTGVDLAS